MTRKSLGAFCFAPCGFEVVNFTAHRTGCSEAYTQFVGVTAVLPRSQKRRSLVISGIDYKGPKMADAFRKAQLTAELLELTQKQLKALEDATLLGWLPGQLAIYQERGERVSFLRRELNREFGQKKPQVLHGTSSATPGSDTEPS